jgi:alkaline phosphatase D
MRRFSLTKPTARLPFAFWLSIITLFVASPLQADSLPLPVSNKVLTRITMGSCAYQWAPQPVFRAIADSKPDLYLSLGDAIYADYDPKKKAPYEVTEETLRREWQLLADSADWQYLTSRVPVMATWDNHDYGHYQAGEEFPLKNISKEIFLDFFGEPEDSARRQRHGIYDAKVFGPEGRRVQVILLDTRSFKTPPELAQRPEGADGSLGKFAPNTDPEASLLGVAQWQWLEQQLRKPAELRLLASSTQVIADQKGMDEWGAYPLERQKLFELIENTGASNLLLLSGNVHFTEMVKIQFGNLELVELTSSGLTHTKTEYAEAANNYRISGPYDGINFGMIEINWNASPSPLVKLAAMNEQGRKVFEHVVQLSTADRK